MHNDRFSAQTGKTNIAHQRRWTLFTVFLLTILGLPFHGSHYGAVADLTIGAALLIYCRWAWFDAAGVLNFFLLALTWHWSSERTFRVPLLWTVRAGALFSFYCLTAMMIALATGYKGTTAEFTIAGFFVRQAATAAICYFFLRRSAWPLFPLRTE